MRKGTAIDISSKIQQAFSSYFSFYRDCTQERKDRNKKQSARHAFAKELWEASKTQPQVAPDEAIAIALDAFPPAVSEAWDEKNMTAMALSSRDMYFLAKRVHGDLGDSMPAFAATGTVGVFSPEEKSIRYLGKMKRSILDYPYSWKVNVDICGHEISHFVDWVSFLSHDKSGFVEVYMEEADVMEEYSRNDVWEYWADACWISVRYPDIAARWIPKTYAWFCRFFNLDLSTGKALN